jgi:NADH-ubiquinone oxidoreductase chain 2
LLLTLQKIAPLILISCQIEINTFSCIAILRSVIVGSVGGLNQTSLRKVLTYSSINHAGWTSAIIAVENLWITNFTFYSILTMTVYIIKPYNPIFINQTIAVNKKAPLMKLITFLTLLNATWPRSIGRSISA